MPHAPGVTLKPLVKLPKDPAGCWEWIGRANANGYPMKQFAGQPIPAGRWLYTMLLGPVPEGLVVARTCGNRNCVSPHHARVTFQAEANRAGINTTLSPQDVTEIRAAGRARTKGLATLLAERYGVTPMTIRDVWARRSHAKAKRRPDAKPFDIPAANVEDEAA